MSVDVLIRPYDDADEQAVLALWRELLPDSAPHNDPEASLAKKLAVDRDLLLVGIIDRNVVGTAMGGYDGHRGWIYSVAVKPEYQRRGVGTLLIRTLEADLKKQGCPKVNLQVVSGNRKAVGFYEQLGYRVEDRISMGKRLYE